MEAKWKAIAAKHLKTDDEDKQEALGVPRYEMRDFLSSNMMREVDLKPIEQSCFEHRKGRLGRSETEAAIIYGSLQLVAQRLIS